MLDNNNFINHKWKSELKNLRKVGKAAYEYRTIHMDRVIQQFQEWASLLSPDDTQGIHHTRKKIRRVERIISNKQMRTKPFRIIKSATKDNFAGGITKFFVPTHATNHKAASQFSNSDRILT
jgi:hypothetical protein